MALSCTKFLEVFRLPKRYIKILVLLPVGIVALAQFSPSAVRAGIMASIASLGGFYSGIRTTSALWQRQLWELLQCLRLRFTRFRISFPLWITLGIILCTSPLSFMLQQTKIMSFLLGRSAKRMERFWMGVCSTLAASTAANRICHAGYAVVFPLHRNLGNFWLIICFVVSFPFDDFVDAFYPLWNAGGYKRFCACFQSNGGIGRIVCTVDFAG